MEPDILSTSSAIIAWSHDISAPVLKYRVRLVILEDYNVAVSEEVDIVDGLVTEYSFDSLGD